jgi:hypothetical protein
MKPLPRFWKAAALGAFALTTLTACFVGGYDGGGGGGYVGGVYAPGGYEYGGWGPGYHVGPPRGDERGPHGRAPPPIPHDPRHGGGDGHRDGVKGH